MHSQKGKYDFQNIKDSYFPDVIYYRIYSEYSTELRNLHLSISQLSLWSIAIEYQNLWDTRKIYLSLEISQYTKNPQLHNFVFMIHIFMKDKVSFQSVLLWLTLRQLKFIYMIGSVVCIMVLFCSHYSSNMQRKLELI